MLSNEDVLGGLDLQGKKSKSGKQVRQAAAILEEHFARLSKEARIKARKELHELATIVSRRVRGKASQSARTAAHRRAVRSRASTS